MERAEIQVSGIVQGVGFRPFVYRLATKHQLVGFVRNMGDAGVQIVVEGRREKIMEFIQALRSEKPPRSSIESIAVFWQPPSREFKDFQVHSSDRKQLGLPSVIPPDLALCDECLGEMLDKNDRRYHYPFITCVNCGPRFTIIEELPYDRVRTSMKHFPLCSDCLCEYLDPADRRYHAEPTACPVCGPRMELYHSSGEIVRTGDPVTEAARLLDEGCLVAVKGIGGIHIAARTTDDGVLERLRKEFDHPQQPFAVMSKDLDTVRTFAEVSLEEAELLTSYRRPIVILKKSPNYHLSELVAPGLDTIGVMLPYSGIHHLLLHAGREPAYVMTSANVTGLPMIVDNNEALARLKNVVDYLLLHNRIIVNRCDDSVVKMIEGKPAFLRRSRGFVPEPIQLAFNSDRSVLALGGDLNVTASILTGNRCFLSQHIGDTSKLETLEYLQEAIARLRHLLNLQKVDFVAHDLHPEYSTSRIAPQMAEKFQARTVAVQHHHAHLCALMAEHGLDELVGVAADGVGYGPDGTAWGGEIMVARLDSYEHRGGLVKQPMPGGDLAAIYPARMVAGILWGHLETAELDRVLREYCPNGFKYGESERKIVLQQLERKLNVFPSSSCGRVLDAVSCLLGICFQRTYEGEPAIKLEAAAEGGEADKVNIEPAVENLGGKLMLNTSKLLLDVLAARKRNVPRKHIAAAAQLAIARGLSQMAIEVAKSEGIEVIGASGGVFCNWAITVAVRKEVEESGLKFVRHELLPPGDGCLSVGQAVVASRMT
ncbi:MAG: carbamoyltransferase HypF [Candidatus Hadarchaeum sp.]|uniref:carbamoyltransferase HypF n=1 Tax=Candidatus Hadarchaeum sp. TaxID=2883567 RepID=UPI003D1511B2